MAKIGLHTSSSGIFSYQKALDVTANNMANVNTNGFKASRASFSDLMYTERGVNDRVHTGHGTRVDKTDLMFEQSAVRETGRMLDFAAMNDGFFAVENQFGQVLYTKDGSFNITETEEGVWQLCDNSGGFILDNEGNRITVPFIPDTDTIDFTALRDMVGTYTFENPYGLDQNGSNYFEANESSGEAGANEDVVLKQGFIEASSTNVANEMSKVIEYQRAFQLNISLLKIHDQLGSEVNNLRN